MPSATTADRSDSIAPRNAIVAASGMREINLSGYGIGSCAARRELGMPPNLVPIVSTEYPNRERRILKIEAHPIAIKNPGQ